jgi:hypothetical protein
MRRRFFMLLAAMSIGLAAQPAGTSAQATQDTTKLPAAMQAVRAQLNTALTGLKAADAAAFFADSALAEFQGQVFSGKPAVQAWLTDALAGVTSLRFSNFRFTISENEIIENADYTVGTPEGEQPGSTETTWRLVNGSWKVVRLRA